jgi:hypothetical protein
VCTVFCALKKDWRAVITAGVGRLLPPVPLMLPLVVGVVVQPPWWPQPREWAPPDHRRLLSERLPVTVAAAAGVGRAAGQLVAADWAGIVEAEPRHDAVGVVDVLTGQLARGLPELEVLLAHGALRAVRQVRPGDPHRRERVDRRRRRRRRPGPVVLGELVDEAVQVGPREVVARVDGRGRGRPPRHRRWRRGRHASTSRSRSRCGRRRWRGKSLAEGASGHGGSGAPAVYDPAAGLGLAVVLVVVLRVERRRERGARRRVDLVQEPAEAARAEDVCGRVRDDAERAAALVAPVHPARPVPRAAVDDIACLRRAECFGVLIGEEDGVGIRELCMGRRWF